MRLIGILGNILSKIYHSAEPRAEGDTLSTSNVDFHAVMDLDRALEEFEASLHPVLCPG